VEDLVQNTFLSFYKAIFRFDTNRPVLPYLYQIARNELKMYYRSHKQTVSLAETLSSKREETLVDQQSATASVLVVLSDEQQKALQLIGEGYSYKEIAQRLGKPLNTVRTIIRRARLLIAQHQEP